MPKPITLVEWCDKHTNSTVALCPPSFQMDDDQSVVFSKWQAWLWQCWLDFIEQAKQIAVGSSMWGIENGDSIDVDAKNRSNQFITRNHIDAISMAKEVDDPLVVLLDRFWMVRGTGAHEGPSGEYAKGLAQALKADNFNGNQFPWEVRIDVSGVLVEATHHSIGGFREASTSASSITRLAEKTILNYAATRDRIPDLVLRGHVHTFADSGDAFKICRALTSGAWQLHTDHSHRSGYGMKLSHIGGWVIRCENGKYEAHRIQYEPNRSPIYYANN